MADAPMPDGPVWTVRSETVAFDASPFVTVTKQVVETDSGAVIDDYYQVGLPDFAIACVVTEDGRILTIWQYKHGARRFGLTLPAGQLEPGEDPKAAMERELREETGYVAQETTHLASLPCNGNQGGGVAHLFLMRGARQTVAPDHHDLETLHTRLMTIAEVDAASEQGAFLALPHFAVWAAARRHLG